MTDWDEWILTAISQRVALDLLPVFDWNDLVSPTGYSYPPLFFWLNGAVLALLGPSMESYRVVTALSEAGAVALVAGLGLQAARNPVVGLTAGLIACSGLWLAYHGTVTVDYLLACAVLAALIAVLRAADKASPQWLWLALLLGGFACFVKYHGVVFHAILCASAIAWPRLRRLVFAGDTPRARIRTASWHGAAALFFPVGLLVIEAITWYEFGWNRTHIAEVFRVMGWESFVVDPISGAIVQPAWHYYLVHTFVEVGPVILALALIGAVIALRTRDTSLIFLGVVVVLWFLWASTASLKNARYVLPAVLMALVFAGVAVERARVLPAGRVLAASLLVIAVLQGALLSGARVRSYVQHGAEADAMLAAVRAQVPHDTTLLVEAEWYAYAATTGSLLPHRVVLPIPEGVVDESGAILTHTRAYEMRASGMLYADNEYLAQREAIVGSWKLVAEAGAGAHRQMLLLRP